ncbi:MAG: SCO family protein [Pseudomonadota bacterium]
MTLALAALAAGTVQAAEPPLPFFVEIEARFDLLDQTGARRTEADFAGRPMLIFFGYANCEAICSVALPAIGEALDLLGDTDVAAMMITVDPAFDTTEALAEAMPLYHDDLIGLTGSEAALEAAREVFQVEREVIFHTIEGTPVYSHGSFIYLTDGAGRVESMLPPILAPERIAEIIRERTASGALE